MDTNTVITNGLNQLLTGLASILVAVAIAWVKKKLGTEKFNTIAAELSTKKELATIAVAYIEQAYKDDGGDVKYTQAATWISQQAAALGIEITDDEVKAIIESAVKAMNDAAKSGTNITNNVITPTPDPVPAPAPDPASVPAVQ